MKKFVFIFLVAFTIFSCTKDEIKGTNDVLSKDVNLLKIKNFSEIKDVNNQKVVYSLLNESEKFKIWNDKLETVLKNEKFNSKQKKLILDLKKELKTVVFSDDDNAYKAYFKNIFVKNYLIELQVSFSRNEIENIFYNINSSERVDSGENGCNCNKGSLFGCGDSCIASTCKSGTSGCGFMWSWECNGNCSLF